MTAWPTEHNESGFTLLELSISLLIVGLLSSGLLLGLSAQRQIADTQAAQHQLDEIREALIGFALSHGRLPCPARATLNSTDAQAGLEDCALQHGVLPWVSLALQESDPWGNRLGYYASERFSGALASGSNASFTLDTLGNANIYDSTGKTLASELPAVIICHGRSAAGAYNRLGNRIPDASGEENENADADLSFIAHTPTTGFDDQLTWIIPSVLKSRMVSAGRLP